ncbi:cytochrome c biogenesis protein CcsA [Escherichia coli]
MVRSLRADISTSNRRPRSQSDAAQHPGLIFHPPLLYLGYGGLMVAASVALASLLRGEFDGACARICWRWALPGWSALTAGIILGSWWAYCELGWGGWWFWIRWKTPLYYPGFLPLRCCTVYPCTAPAGDFSPLVAVTVIVT